MTPFRLAPAALLVVATPLAAQQTRQMDAHIHGTGEMQVAIEAQSVAIDFTVPGADIVGFEHAPGSDDDRAAIDAALAQFDDAFTLFTIEGDAGCTAVTVVNHTHGFGIGDDTDHAHDDHAHDDHDDHGHEAEPAAHAHDDHDHDHDHAADADHDDHDHAGGGHAEFHATYELTCTDAGAITAIGFPYFDLFPNALEIDVQIVSDTGAMSAEVVRTAPRLSLVGAM